MARLLAFAAMLFAAPASATVTIDWVTVAMLAIAPQTPNFALVFSSCSRSRLFGRHAGEEIAAIRMALGNNIPVIGFYDYGEQAPLSAAGFRGRSHFHNESLVVCAISAK